MVERLGARAVKVELSTGRDEDGNTLSCMGVAWKVEVDVKEGEETTCEVRPGMGRDQQVRGMQKW